MRFALVDNIKREAAKGMKGICSSCGSDVTAKCGEVKINHWAHKTSQNCDPWWENETEWHRAWKNQFPIEFQEIVLKDEQTGEKHIADVRTLHDLVIEFQHSHLHPHERRTRESFYKHMVWVVDGTRLKRDYPSFIKGKQNWIHPTSTRGEYWVDNLEDCFPTAWLGSTVPVIFDFKGLETINDPNDLRHLVICLFPTSQREARLVYLTRESFIANVISGKWFPKTPPPTQPLIAPTQQSHMIPRRSSPYVFHRGRYVKRRRL